MHASDSQPLYSSENQHTDVMPPSYVPQVRELPHELPSGQALYVRQQPGSPSWPTQSSSFTQSESNAAWQPSVGTPSPAPTSTNTLAVLGLVFAFIIPLVGLILSVIAKEQIERTGEQGEDLATAGLWVSIGWFVLRFILFIGWYVLVGAALLI